MSTPSSGLVIVDKPGGITSHGVVSRVRRLAGTRKVGHAGTLDPMATGVLVLGINRATRLLGHLMLTEKRYDATIRLGESRHTDDAEGEVTATASASHLGEEQVRTTALGFVGDLLQVPTAVSAIKVDGKRAHQLVREGEQVDLKARPVTVHELDVSEVRRVGDFVDLDVSVRCSSGTYIRAIARDLGGALGVGGHLTVLRRTAVGEFDLSVARSLQQLEEEFTFLPIAEAARRSFASLDLSEQEAAAVRVGRKVAVDIADTTALFAPDGEFLALYEPAGSGSGARAVAVFVG